MDLFTKIKSITSFTESEQIFIQYILDRRLTEIINLVETYLIRR